MNKRIVSRVGQYADASHLRLIGESDPEDPYQWLELEEQREAALEEAAEGDECD
jgi:hypothetical protein